MGFSREEQQTLGKVALAVTLITVVVLVITYIIINMVNGGITTPDDGDQQHTVLTTPARQPANPTSTDNPAQQGEATTSPENDGELEQRREPLPGENKAQLVNPDGETVFQRYRGNFSPESGLALWGDAFKHPVRRTSFVGPQPNPTTSVKGGPNEDPVLTKRSMDMVTNMYSFRLQDYPNMTCAIAGFDTDLMTDQLKRRLKDVCAADPNPTVGWQTLMEGDAFSKVFSIDEVIQGNAEGFNDTGHTSGRVYYMSIGFTDFNGNVVAEPMNMTVVTKWKQLASGWTLTDIHAQPEG